MAETSAKKCRETAVRSREIPTEGNRYWGRENKMERCGGQRHKEGETDERRMEEKTVKEKNLGS